MSEKKKKWWKYRYHYPLIKIKQNWGEKEKKKTIFSNFNYLKWFFVNKNKYQFIINFIWNFYQSKSTFGIVYKSAFALKYNFTTEYKNFFLLYSILSVNQLITPTSPLLKYIKQNTIFSHSFKIIFLTICNFYNKLKFCAKKN